MRENSAQIAMPASRPRRILPFFPRRATETSVRLGCAEPCIARAKSKATRRIEALL
jgi:hypothetical protein